jgi:hypothetical protein
LSAGNTNQIVIGASAIGLGSNSVVLGNDSIVTTALKGNIGIGTTSPARKLDVTINTADVALQAKSTSTGVLFDLISTGTTAQSGFRFQNTGDRYAVGLGNDHKFYISNSSGYPQEGTNSLVFDGSTGNVGIGTTSPSELLSVGASSQFRVTSSGSIYAPLIGISGSGVVNASFTSTASSGSGSGSGMVGYSDDGAALASGDRLGFYLLGGANNASHTLVNAAGISSSATEAWSGSGNGASLRFEVTANGATSRNVAMIIDQSGSVGIGTTSPTSRIHGVTTLSADTGNEIAYQLNYTTNKAAGNDTGLLINMTDTASPGTSYMLDVQQNSGSRFRIRNTGVVEVNQYLTTQNGNTTLNLQGGNDNSTPNLFPVTVSNATYGQTSGSNGAIKIAPIYNQASGTAANTDLLINRTETAVGSGAQNLIDAQVGGVSKFRVDNVGNIFSAGTQLAVPDYVFEPNYNLMPLSDLADYVEANKHLPNIPSEADIKKNGINHSALLMGLLEKTEENTLYLIGQGIVNNEQGVNIDSLTLKTDQNITTIQQLQISVDEQLGVVQKSLTANSQQLETFDQQFAEFGSQLAIHSSRIDALETLTVILQQQMEELKAQIATPVNVAQIDLNAQDILYLKQLLGITKDSKPGDIAILGKFTAEITETGMLAIKIVDKESPTIGSAAIKTGETRSVISTKAVSENSEIFVTAKNVLTSQPLVVMEKSEGESFAVEVKNPVETDIEFSWWIVGKKD